MKVLQLSIFRLLAIICFVIALIVNADGTTVLGAGWAIWVTAGLLAWAVEPLLKI